MENIRVISESYEAGDTVVITGSIKEPVTKVEYVTHEDATKQVYKSQVKSIKSSKKRHRFEVDADIETIEEDGERHRFEDDGQRHRFEDDGQRHRFEDDGQRHRFEDDGQRHRFEEGDQRQLFEDDEQAPAAKRRCPTSDRTEAELRHTKKTLKDINVKIEKLDSDMKLLIERNHRLDIVLIYLLTYPDPFLQTPFPTIKSKL